ncbi:UNVERIFIED_CONTAM: hypothetical protein FKN15_018674 [Acipenser sinensis]
MENTARSIHDHTNSHCFLKLLQGRLKETLYDWPEDKRSKQELHKRCEINFEENQCTYINDSIGLHRVENSSHCDRVVSLHLYSPPFDTCHTFDERTGHRNSVKMTFWSKYGERTAYVFSPPCLLNDRQLESSLVIEVRALSEFKQNIGAAPDEPGRSSLILAGMGP